jgi:hypothetical protein
LATRRGPGSRPEAQAAKPPAPGRETDRPASRGPVWGDASAELNATILEWPPGDGPGETVSQLDVVYVVLSGSVLLNDEVLHAGEARIVGQGEPRTVVAGSDGARYLTAHRRRGPLQIT